MSISSFALQTNFNIKNAMANSTLTDLMKVRKQTIRESLSDFENEEHRIEKVLQINGVQYINDSKAVNVNATYYALESIDVSTVWIVGGIDKGNDYEALLPLVNEKVKAIICLGYDNQKIIESFGNIVDFMIETSSMEEAVKIAYKLTENGETVILSPACASYDMFENYEDRGNQFKKAVRLL
jgi:UDP-N-acetylmuramoylalanine--D-glutamate ligase